MRKVLLSISFLAMATFIFYACKKESECPSPATTSSSTASQDVIIKNGRLAFGSIDSYETFISNPQSLSSNAKIANSKKSSSDTLIDDDFLASILNENNIIEIEGKAYKLDFAEYKVYVLSEITDANMILLENKDVSSGKIKVYSMDDEVLFPEDEQSTPNARARCHGHRAPRRKGTNKNNGHWPELTNMTYNGGVYYNMRPEAKVVYQKAGIYFALVAKFKYLYKPAELSWFYVWSAADTYMEGSISFEYLTVCNKHDAGNNIPIEEECKNVMVYRPYQSSRGLSKYKLEAEFDCRISGCHDNTNGVYSTDVAINYEY